MRNFLILLFLVQSTFSFGQASTYDPYSSYGLGEEGSLGDAQFTAIGNVKSAYIDSTLVNFYNPSSYSFLGKGFPLTSVNLTGRLTSISQNGSTSTYSIANLTHIALAFPITRRFGFGAGLTPFSRKGYNVNTTVEEDGDSVYYLYRGSGTTQRAFLGASFQILRTDRHILAVGSNLGFVFGGVSNERYAKYESLTTAGLDETIYRMKSIYTDFGLTYRLNLDTLKRQYITLGMTYAPEQKMNTEMDYALYYMQGTASQGTEDRDTITFNQDQKGEITYPSKLNIGFGYTFRPANKLGNFKHVFELGVYGEFGRTTWSRYSESFPDAHGSPSFYDATKISLGFTYRPNVDYINKTAGSKAPSRFQYKLGFYNQSLPTTKSIAQLNETAITGGLSIPLIALKNSSFNFGFALGQRTNGTSTAVSEKFVNFSVGIVISPSANDSWFRKYKLD